VTLVAGLAADMRAQGTRYAEVTVTPVTHMRAGIPAGELAQALDAGATAARAQGVALAWVYDISGRDGRQGAQLTLALARASIEARFAPPALRRQLLSAPSEPADCHA
jgi:hypothetical protein